MQGGVTYALEGPPSSKLPFLKGLGKVCSRMPARQAEMLLDHVQQCVSDHSPNEEDPDWQDYFAFLALTQDRTAKGGQPKSALKGRLYKPNPMLVCTAAVGPSKPSSGACADSSSRAGGPRH